MLKYDPEVNMQKVSPSIEPENISFKLFRFFCFAIHKTAFPLLQQTALQKPKPQIKKTNIISNWKNLFKI